MDLSFCLVYKNENDNFAIPMNHRVKIKISKKIDWYSDLAWELKKAVQHKKSGDCC